MTPGRAVPVAALWVAACTSPALLPEEPRAVDRVIIHPYAMHEECMQLAAGERLDYRYETSEPIHFEIHYRDAGAVLAPLVRDDSRRDSGIYAAAATHDYCLVWQAGAAGAVLGYRVVRHVAPR